MHCLFISSLLPEPEPRTGFEIANAAIMRAYEDAGVRLTKVGFRRPGGPSPREDEILLGDLVIENAGAGAARKAAWVLRALRFGLPVAGAKLRVLSRESLLERLSAAGAFDGLILNSVQMPAAYPFLVDVAPSVFVAHNVEAVSARQNAARATGLHERLLFEREARLVGAVEAGLCRSASAVHTLTREDAQMLGLAGSERAVPLALSLGRVPRPDDGRRTHDIGLIGTWSWAPNRAGLDWFLQEVVPRLPPTMSIAIAGQIEGRPPVPGHVAFLGRVPDAQAFIHSSRILALPTTAGTGVQLKTLEMLEEGLPAVATPLALRGIEGKRPETLSVTEDPTVFAKALAAGVEAERAGRLTRGGGGDFAARRRDEARAAAMRGMSLLAAARERREASR